MAQGDQVKLGGGATPDGGRIGGQVRGQVRGQVGGQVGWQVGAGLGGAATRFIVLVAIYVGFEWISDLREYRGLPVTAWNPGLGVLFAAMARGERTAPAALFVGAFIAEQIFIQAGFGLSVSLAAAGVVAGAYWLVALIARAMGLDAQIERVRDVGLLLSAALGGALLTGLLLTLLLAAAGAGPAVELGSASAPLLVGDMIGVALIAPLVLRSSRPGARDQFQDLSFVAGVASAAIVAVIFVWLMLREPGPPAYESFYFLFLPVVFVALRNGLDGACLTLAATQIALVAGLNHYAYDPSAFAQFQTLMTVLVASGLLAGAVSSERDAASRAARAARAQLKEKESEAARADRFHAVTGLASALAHEINQPMTAARAFARTADRLAEQEPADLARVRDYLGRTVAQIDGAAAILRSMREFMRRGDGGRALAAPADIVKDALLLVRPLATQHRVRLVDDSDGSVPALACDRVQIQQVLVNLIGNAVEAIGEAGQTDGVVAIATRLVDGRLEFSVRDNGPGVPADFAARVFEPLATTKPGGLGLGLAISADIVEAHGGRIWLDSAARGGTEFRFWLPLARERRDEASEEGYRGQP
jgi:signal transduction histidine kinase